MASPPILNFDALLAPIEGPNPAGEPLSFTVRAKLDEARKEINPAQFAENDPRRPQFQAADWAGVEQLAQEILTQTSKDLMVAARLTEALVKQHGFRGLRDGLRLLRRLSQECWDRVHPEIQDGDVEVRATAFLWLDEDIRGVWFPNTVRMIPLTKVDSKPGEEENKTNTSLGWQHWKDAQTNPKGPVTAADFDRAVAATPRDFCQTNADDLGESVTELMELCKTLTAKNLGERATMSKLRSAVLDCNTLAQQILQRKGPPPAPAAPKEAQGAPPVQANGAAQPAVVAAPEPVRRAPTRDDVLEQLAAASTLLLQMEPHSPIAYMIQRAVKLARLPLPELMKVLVRDPGVLGQLDRDLDLGLEKQDPAKAGAQPVKK